MQLAPGEAGLEYRSMQRAAGSSTSLSSSSASAMPFIGLRPRSARAGTNTTPGFLFWRAGEAARERSSSTAPPKVRCWKSRRRLFWQPPQPHPSHTLPLYTVYRLTSRGRLLLPICMPTLMQQPCTPCCARPAACPCRHLHYLVRGSWNSNNTRNMQQHRSKEGTTQAPRSAVHARMAAGAVPPGKKSTCRSSARRPPSSARLQPSA
jgi:hypothetical protein